MSSRILVIQFQLTIKISTKQARFILLSSFNIQAQIQKNINPYLKLKQDFKMGYYQNIIIKVPTAAHKDF
ncbi:MAG TPA: hypothetical protein V6D19_03040, partial [Stenomitos sp.]